jgi:hypothetical protein
MRLSFVFHLGDSVGGSRFVSVYAYDSVMYRNWVKRDASRLECY